MRLRNVLFLVKDYLILGIAALSFVSIIICIVYFLVYKLMLKGKKKPSKKTILLSMITFLYIVAVFGAVFLNRPGRIGRDSGLYILYPFYSYREAWNGWSSYGWRLIVLNIAMFVPFGFLLPLWSEKLQSFWRILTISFLFTLFIEGVQYFTGLGIFEADDLINNTLGALIGYGIIMLLLALIKKKRLRVASILTYLSPALITAAVFAIIFSLYHFKELGTLTTSYIYPKDMDKIKIVSDINYSSEEGKAMVYKAPSLTVSEAEDFADEFFRALGTSVDVEKNDIYDETGVFDSEDGRHNLWINYKGGSYNYNYFDTEFVPNASGILKDASEEDILEALLSMKIQVPQGASFKYYDKRDRFTFQADLIEEEGIIFDGILRCDYHEDGTIKDIDNEMIALQPYKEVEIISQEEAFSKVMEGKFVWWYGQDSEMQTLTIGDITLDYQLDSKGYYQPVYSFSVNVEGEEAAIMIPAIR